MHSRLSGISLYLRLTGKICNPINCPVILGGAKEPGMMYFPGKWGRKTAQNEVHDPQFGCISRGLLVEGRLLIGIMVHWYFQFLANHWGSLVIFNLKIFCFRQNFPQKKTLRNIKKNHHHRNLHSFFAFGISSGRPHAEPKLRKWTHQLPIPYPYGCPTSRPLNQTKHGCCCSSFLSRRSGRNKGVFHQALCLVCSTDKPFALTGLNLLQIVPPLHSQKWLCRYSCSSCFKLSLENVEGRAFWFWAPLNSIDPLSTRCCACNKMQRTVVASGVSASKKIDDSVAGCFFWCQLCLCLNIDQNLRCLEPRSVMGTIWGGLPPGIQRYGKGKIRDRRVGTPSLAKKGRRWKSRTIFFCQHRSPGWKLQNDKSNRNLCQLQLCGVCCTQIRTWRPLKWSILRSEGLEVAEVNG